MAKKSPDALGDEARAQLVAAHLEAVQGARLSLDLMQISNSAVDKDPIPGIDPGENGEVVTYEKRAKQLDAAEQQILDDYGDVMPAVKKLLKSNSGGSK